MPLLITGMDAGLEQGSTKWEIWYRTDSVNGVNSTKSGWIKHESGTCTVGTSGIINLGMQNILRIPAGKTYGMCLVSDKSVYISDGAPYTIRDSYLQIYEGMDVGYAGGNFNPVFWPKGFSGTFYYQFDKAPHDAGITALQSPLVACAGTQDVKVTVENFGTKAIDTLTVNWSIDGVAQTVYKYYSKLDTTSSVTLTLGTISVTQLAQELKIWTSGPNNKADTVNLNDTISTMVKAALKGTFTIGGTNPDYATVVDAVNDLNASGVCGPVTYNIRAGTYTGQIHLKAIPGTSATNTITFNGAGRANTFLEYTSSGDITVMDINLLLLEGTDYVTFRDMTIENKGKAYACAIILTSGADYNAVINCDIKVVSHFSTAAIRAAGDPVLVGLPGNSGSYNLIKDNSISGGQVCVHWTGSRTGYVEGNRFIKNTISDFLYKGVLFYYNRNLEVQGNTLSKSNMQYPDGIEFNECSNFSLTENELNCSIELNQCNVYYHTGKRIVIANNIAIGFTLRRTVDVDVYHNSISGGAYVGGGAKMDIRNNIFVNTSSNGYAFQVDGNNPKPTFDYIDHNIYYAPFSTYPILHDVPLLSLDDWRYNYPQYNEHSLEQDPYFVSSTDLHVVQNKPLPYGPALGYPTDVDGDARCRFAPTIGADESAYGKDWKPTARITGPDTLFVNSPADFTGNMTAGVPHTNLWYLDGVFIKDSANVEVSVTSAGTHTLKVVAQGCQKKDSVTKTIIVVNPTNPPASDFIVSTHEALQGEDVTIEDLSTGGPTSLKWEIFPSNGIDEMGNTVEAYTYVHGDNNSRHATLKFNLGGTYKICLTATNSIGSSTKCKNEVINIIPLYKIPGAAANRILRDRKGVLTDDGGNVQNTTGTYSNNFTGKVVIDPCAEEVYMVFKDFDLQCGADYLYVYDGSDAKGKALHRCPAGFTGGPSTNCTQGCVPTVYDTIVAKSGRMYIEMKTNNSNAYKGFEAFWWAGKPKKADPPVASFDVPDSVCYDNPVTFSSTSNDESMRYFWDFDGDYTAFEGFTKSATYVFFTPGKHTVTMIAINCGGIDTITKEIVAFAPGAPTVSFSADNTRPTIKDIVFFSPEIKRCVSEYKWTFTPASGIGKAAFVNGTNATSSNPQVLFTDTGCYTVQLYAKNAGGEDSLAISCFVRVKNPYCIPSVDKNIQDIGISFVGVHTMANFSDQGVSDYENFISTDAASLQAGASYELTVKGTSGVNPVTRTIWVDWDQDGSFIGSGEKIAEEKNAYTQSFSSKFTVPTGALFGATVMRVAINHGSLNNIPCGPNKYGEFEDYRVYVIADNTLPLITLLGDDTVYVEQGYAYTEAGATAEDNLDGDITAKIKKTNSPTFSNMILGTYLIHFDVQDARGNQAQRVTRVVIVTPDVTAPNLVLPAPDTIRVEVFDASFTAPDPVLAEDLLDGDLLGAVSRTGNVNVNVLGIYEITYSVTDASGNTAVVKRVVMVEDRTAPVLTLIDSSTVIHEAGTTYTDAGVTITDNYYSESNLRDVLVMQGNLNINVTGTYIVLYSLTDPSGNGPVTVTRTVIVNDSKAPVITMSGPDTVLLEVGSVFTEPEEGTTATDAFEGELSVNTGGSFYSKFPDGLAAELGFYTIEYTAKDAAGNSDTAWRTVKVVDTKAPVITLKGDGSVNICRWDSYTDSGYDVSDNYTHSSNTVTVSQKGNFTGTAKGGVFTLWYEATDISGNLSKSDIRVIHVDPDPYACGRSTGIEETDLEQHIRIYPNPNSGRFTVSLDLPQAEQVKVKVLNLVGQEIALIADDMIRSGQYEVNLSDQASGVYMLSVTTGSQHIVKRIVVNK